MDTLHVLLMAFISIVIVNNLVLTKFLGICPYLGVSSRIDMAFGMGLAVTFVVTLSGTLTWLIDTICLLYSRYRRCGATGRDVSAKILLFAVRQFRHIPAADYHELCNPWIVSVYKSLGY
jgi:hypothetical protein